MGTPEEPRPAQTAYTLEFDSFEDDLETSFYQRDGAAQMAHLARQARLTARAHGMLGMLEPTSETLSLDSAELVDVTETVDLDAPVLLTRPVDAFLDELSPEARAVLKLAQEPKDWPADRVVGAVVVPLK